MSSISTNAMLSVIGKIKQKYFSKGSNRHRSKSIVGQNCPSINVDLIDYLDNIKNYNQFASYLNSCFAIENLKFLQTIVIFRNALLLSLDESHQYQTPKFLNRVFNIKFNFLKQLSDDYIKQINDGEINDILFKIYNQFISSSSDESINISWTVRKELMAFFDDTHDRHKETELKYISLDLFNSAILEIYGLLDTRYSTDFNLQIKKL